MTAPLKPEFVMGRVDENQPQKVNRVARVDTFLAEFTDGEGRKQVRLCYVVPGTEAVMMLAERIDGAPVATQANAWFARELLKKLSEGKPVESV